MKHIKTFENYNTLKDPRDIIKEYCEKYPKHSEFFTNFLKVFPTYQSFKECEFEYNDYNQDYDEEKDEDYDDSNWSPENEVYMIKQEVGSYPGNDIWPHFYNDMNSSTWDFYNTPLGKDKKKYNL